jgi:DNA-binding response OmpR family regulator
MSEQSQPTSGSTPVRVLVVEDDVLLARGLCRNLELEGFAPSSLHSGEEALDRLAREPAGFEIVVLDIMLPGVDGLEVCRRLREAGNDVPILFLTARGSDADRILGLRLGADDYLTKPFVFEELVLRLRGILRRTAWSRTPAPTGPVIRFASAVIELDELRAETPAGTIQLTDREAMLMRYFAENDGRVLTRGELLEHVWGYSFDTATRTLDTFIHRLRKYFEPDPGQPRHFHTVRGVGYRFTSEAEE